MRTHGGICIGGPEAGKFYAHESFTLVIRELSPASYNWVDPITPLGPVTEHHYVFVTIDVEEDGVLRTGAWVLPEAAPPNRRMTPVQLMELMAADYADKCNDMRALDTYGLGRSR